MFFARVLVLIAALACGSALPVKDTGFVCPPAEQIHPCTCSRWRRSVKCYDVKNLDIVRKALENRFPNPLPSLYITNVHTFQLPRHAFRNINSQKLYIDGSNIRHIHDDAFDGQDSLEILIMSNDRITDFPTEALRRLPDLQSLNLVGNLIMKITDQSIGYHPHLKTLMLSDNRLSHIEQNAFPRTLRYLSVARNLLTTLNRTLHHLSKLDSVIASNNRLTSVKDEFRGLYSLDWLRLSNNNLFDISGCFDDLASLTMLDLSFNKLEKVEEGLYPLKKLKNLSLAYNYINELDENLFKSLNAIEFLDLSGNYIKNICRVVKPLKELSELKLSDTNLQTLDYDCFKGMKNLRLLDLSKNELTDIDAVTGHSLPNMRNLLLQNNRLHFFRYGLKNLRQLYELDVRDNDFTSIKAHQFTHNTQLAEFKIEGNPWDCSDHLLEIFGELALKRVQLIGAPSCYLEGKTMTFVQPSDDDFWTV